MSFFYLFSHKFNFRTSLLGYPPSRIDLITTPDGIDFDTCYQSKLEIVMNNISVNFIDLENLKKNKKASGRLQDLADLENLE